MRLALVQFVLLSLSEGPGILESLLATNCVWPEVAGRVILPIEELQRPSHMGTGLRSYPHFSARPRA